MWKTLPRIELVLDTSVLLEFSLLIINEANKTLSEFKRIRLTEFIELFQYRKIIIVPQVLAELYSLLKREAKDKLSLVRVWLEKIENPLLMILIEKPIPKDDILGDKNYQNFGFTDIALIKNLNEYNCLITTDMRLIQLCKGYENVVAYHIDELIE